MSLSDQSQQWYPTSVQVTVFQARSLRIKGKNGTNDAYAIMQVAKDKFSTSVAEKSVAPVWKEEATFELPLFHNGNTDNCTLHVTVMHRALMGPDKLLGRADINLWELSELKSRNKTEWYTLLDKTGKQDKDRGEVLVDIQFMKNNMTASMFDLSATDKPRSRLGKFKDKVRGKKKEGLSDSASAVVPSFTQVLTESEGEGDGQGEEGAEKDKKKKKNKLKSLFSPKSNLQRQGLSQSMSVLGPLPEKNTSLTDSHSSGLNIDSSEGKKKFKFLTHKRTESSDSKASQGSLSLGRSKIPAPVEPSNLCINGSHVYTEEPQPRSSGTGSTFSLASSGHDSMEDLHSRAEEEYEEETVWMDEERRRKGELERNTLEEERMRKEEQEKKRARQEEERLRFEEEERRLKEEERMRIKLEESIRKEEQEKRKKVDEEKIRLEEERKMMEEKERMRKQEEEEERLRKEDQERRSLEEKRKEIEDQERREEEERMRREEHERMKRVDRLRKEEERNIRGEEERLQREKEERIREENERIHREEEEKDLQRREEEHRKMQEEEERGRREKERLNREKEEERKRELDRLRNEEKKIREEEERVRKAEEEERVRKTEEEERVRKTEEEERVRKAEEEERVRKAEEEERVRKEMEVKRTKEEEQIKGGEADRLRKLEEERKIRDEERLRREEVRRMEEEQRQMRKEEEKRLEERKKEEAQRRLDEENEEEKRRDEEQRRALLEAKERFRVEEENKKKEEFRRQDERMREEEKKRNAQIKGVVRLEEVEKQMEQNRETEATLSNNPFEEVSPSPFHVTISNNPFEETPTTSPNGPISCRTNKVSAVKPRPSMGSPPLPCASSNYFSLSSSMESPRGAKELSTDLIKKKDTAPVPTNNQCWALKDNWDSEANCHSASPNQSKTKPMKPPPPPRRHFSTSQLGSKDDQESVVGQDHSGVKQDEGPAAPAPDSKGWARQDNCHSVPPTHTQPKTTKPPPRPNSPTPLVGSRDDQHLTKSVSKEDFGIRRDRDPAPPPPNRRSQTPSQTQINQSMTTASPGHEERVDASVSKVSQCVVPMVTPLRSSSTDTTEKHTSGGQSSTHGGNQAEEPMPSATGGLMMAKHNKGPAPSRPRNLPGKTAPKADVEKHTNIDFDANNPFAEDCRMERSSGRGGEQAGKSQESLDSNRDCPSVCTDPGPFQPYVVGDMVEVPTPEVVPAEDGSSPTKSTSAKRIRAPLPPVKKAFASRQEGTEEKSSVKPQSTRASTSSELSSGILVKTQNRGVGVAHPCVIVAPAPSAPSPAPSPVISSPAHSEPQKASEGRTDSPPQTTSVSSQGTLLHTGALPFISGQCSGEEAGGIGGRTASSTHRPHPVKPLNSMENQPISNNQEVQAGKCTGILGGLQEKIKFKDTGVKGPYSQLTQEELISLVVKQQEQLSNRDNKIKELEQYIDNLLVRIIEEHPSILMS